MALVDVDFAKDFDELMVMTRIQAKMMLLMMSVRMLAMLMIIKVGMTNLT